MDFNKIATLAFLLAISSLQSLYAQETIYEKEDSIFIENIIRKLSNRDSATEGCKITSIAKEFYGKEYVSGTLDRYSNEPLFISSKEVDCTTFVELVLSLYLTPENGCFDDVCRNLERIRYRNGKRNGYISRLHYISWWIDDNSKQKIVNEIYTLWHTAEQSSELYFMSRHPESYPQLKEAPELIKEISAYEKIYNNKTRRYIPKEKIAELSNEDIRNGDIIAIVTNIKGLDVAHIGFAYWQKNELHLIHASSSRKKVLCDPLPLSQYLANNSRHIGIRIFRTL